MPTLIRIFVFLVVLAGLALGGMLALTIFVDPGQKEMRVKIPARDLGVETAGNDPLGIRPAPAAAPALEPAPAVPVPVEEPPPPGTKDVDIPE